MPKQTNSRWWDIFSKVLISLLTIACVWGIATASDVIKLANDLPDTIIRIDSTLNLHGSQIAKHDTLLQEMKISIDALQQSSDASDSTQKQVLDGINKIKDLLEDD